MKISWRDLNKVQEAGDYPFRDGTIAVTFAEIAIWNKNPSAQFQLMRKHPIQSTFKYVLGKQVDERLAPVNNEFIYEGSSGDSWSLTRDPATGARAVMHRPNAPSGGKPSYIELDKFLAQGANGPEHQALRRLLETSTRLPSILIAYDIHPPRDADHDELVHGIQALGTWLHHLETVWIVQSAHTPEEIRDRLKSHIGTEDQLLVIDISGDTAGWVGVNDIGSKWLAENI